MKTSNLKMTKYPALFCLLLVILSFSIVSAQSINQNYPTPVSSNELSGTIAARDVGDARLTTYFFTFDGTQGDVFINVKTANLDGDIDVFTRDGSLRPLTKITVFADAPGSGETGRVVYLRKPEKLILRIQGRTPNDEAATFNLRFAGSFVPVQPSAENDLPGLPEIKTGNQTDILVNSVGTIIEVKPKPTPLPKETVAVSEQQTETTGEITSKTEAENKVAKTTPRKRPARTSRRRTPKKSVEPSPVTTAETETKEVSEKSVEAENSAVKTPAPNNNKRRTRQKAAGKSAAENKKAPEPNPLETVRLIIELKDGTKIERVMTEVLRVGVDKGTLTLITKDGKTSRFSILDVARITIE